MGWRRWVAAGTLAGLLASACGDDDGGGSGGAVPLQLDGQCGSFDACGGDPTGTWRITSACTESPFELPRGLDPEACATFYEDVSGTVSGTVTLRDGALTTSTTTTLRLVVNLSEDCLGSPVTEANCEQSEQSLREDFAMGGANASTTCTFANAVCRCEVTATEATSLDSTYTLEGTSIVDDEGSRSEFCVEGDTLRVRDLEEGGFSFALTR